MKVNHPGTMRTASNAPRPFARRDACGRAFTLLEIIMAVAILAIITISIYQFTSTTVHAAAMSTRAGDEDSANAGLRRLLGAQLGAMPSKENGTLIGMVVDGKNGRRDVLQMVCTGGNALLTPDARGYYQVTLDLHEIPRGSGHYALGMERQPWTADDDDDDDDDVPNAKPNTKPGDILSPAGHLPSDWVSLMENVQSLEFAYFDARLNGWVDKWTDQAVLPNLVRMRLTPVGSSVPYEIVERVPGGGLRKDIPQITLPNVNTQAQTSTGNPVPPGSAARQ